MARLGPLVSCGSGRRWLGAARFKRAHIDTLTIGSIERCFMKSFHEEFHFIESELDLTRPPISGTIGAVNEVLPGTENKSDRTLRRLLQSLECKIPRSNMDGPCHELAWMPVDDTGLGCVPLNVDQALYGNANACAAMLRQPSASLTPNLGVSAFIVLGRTKHDTHHCPRGHPRENQPRRVKP